MSNPRVYKNLPVSEFKRGSHSLVPIRDEDKYSIMQWRNEQIDVLRQKEPLTREGQEKYFKNVVDKLFEMDKPDQLLFSFLENNKLIGYGGLVHIDWESSNGEISFLTETSRNHQFKKDWSVYLTLLKQLVQSQLNFFKIYTYAYDVRPLLIETLLENKFREEARMHKHIRVGGNLHDVLIHSYFFDDLYLRLAEESDMETYFNWANDAAVRANSFNQAPILLDQHEKWFAGKLKSNKSVLFVAEVNEIPVGQIRFEEIEDAHYEINFSIDGKYRGRSLGSKLLKAGAQSLLTKVDTIRRISGKVKTDNRASLSSFEEAGFVKDSTTDGVATWSYKNLQK